MVGGGRGAERGHRERDAVLGQGDDVHVALDHHQALELAYRGARLVEAVELTALVEQRALGGIHVLGRVVGQGAPAEADHAATPVADRKHHAIAEPVVAAPFAALDQQAELEQAGGGLAAEGIAQTVPAGRRVAETEARRDRAVHATRLEVVDGARPLAVFT